MRPTAFFFSHIYCVQGLCSMFHNYNVLVPLDKTRSLTSPINLERTANSPPRNMLTNLPTTFACLAEALDIRQANVQRTLPPLPKQKLVQLVLREDCPPLQIIQINRAQLWWLCTDWELHWTPPCTYGVETQCICSLFWFFNNSFNFYFSYGHYSSHFSWFRFFSLFYRW